MRYIQKLLLALFITATFFNAQGSSIIRDSEIEETINLIAEPLLRTAKLKGIKIYLINDQTLNAFTNGSNEIYIYSGMMNSFADLDVIRGVIAHEIGHIIGKHVARQLENIDNYNKLSLSSIAIGLASAASGNAALATAIALGGMHISERSVLSYSRTFEASADHAALKLLESNGYSCKGMIEFFNYISKQIRDPLVNVYDQTHPLSNERLLYLQDFYQKSKFKTDHNPFGLEYKFARSRAKLIAFTTQDPAYLLENIPADLNPEIADYMRSICYFRISNLDKALQYVNRLIEQYPKDPYYNELKGQILFEFGKPEALSAYVIAAQLRPDDLLIKTSKAIVGITIYQNESQKMLPFYQDLKTVSDKERDNNPLILYYLAMYYEKTGQSGQSILCSAIIAQKSGDIKRAKLLASAALKNLEQGTPSWYKASDIINSE